LINPFVVIIPAAGSGSRYLSEKPKQYSLIKNKTVLEFSIEPFLDFSECLGICLSVSLEDDFWKSLTFINNPKIHFTEGGGTRLLSVKAGVEFWKKSSASYLNILVHDSSRPCLRSSDVRGMLEDFSKGHFDASVLGSPISDTLKKVSQNGLIEETADRSLFWRAFTPQLFTKEILERGFDSLEEGINFTDEAGMIEKISAKIRSYNGSSDNIKITYPEDMNLAKSILLSQGRL